MTLFLAFTDSGSLHSCEEGRVRRTVKPGSAGRVNYINTEDTSRVDSASRQERIAARTRGASARVSLIQN